jgi:hypothetical protein
MDGKRVINGTFGEVWMDSDKLADCFGLQAKIDIKKEDVPICGKLGTSKKVTGWDGKGSVKMNKINSRMSLKLKQMLKDGKDVRVTIISKLADPDAFGSERVVLKSVSFDDLTLADWENAKPGQIECPFTFEDYDYLDEIQPQ